MATHPVNTGSSGVDGQHARLPAAVIEDLLDSPRRRQLLVCLTEREDPVPVGDLASVLTPPDTEQPGTVTATELREARTEIYQDLLPKLTETGVVTFDSKLGTVEFTGSDALAMRLEALSETCGESGTKDK